MFMLIAGTYMWEPSSSTARQKLVSLWPRCLSPARVDRMEGILQLFRGHYVIRIWLLSVNIRQFAVITARGTWQSSWNLTAKCQFRAVCGKWHNFGNYRLYSSHRRYIRQSVGGNFWFAGLQDLHSKNINWADEVNGQQSRNLTQSRNKTTRMNRLRGREL